MALAVSSDASIVAHHFGVDPQLLAAVVKAEGNILKAVQCTYPDTASEAAALEITARSAVHAMSDFLKTRYAAEFVAFWAARWAPVGVANDPHGLNANWRHNVLAAWIPAVASKMDVGADVPGGGAA